MNERGFTIAPVLWGLAVAGLIVFTLAQVMVAEQRRMRNRALINESLMIVNAVRVFQTENTALETAPGDPDEAGWPDPEGPDGDIALTADNCEGALAAMADAGNLHPDYGTSSVSRADARMEWSADACTANDFTLRLECRSGIAGLAPADPGEACPTDADLDLLAVRSGGVHAANAVTWTLYRAAEYPAIRNAIDRSLHQTLSANYVRGHTPDFIDPFANPPVLADDGGYPPALETFPPRGLRPACPDGRPLLWRYGINSLSLAFRGWNAASLNSLSVTVDTSFGADTRTLIPISWQVINTGNDPDVRIDVIEVLPYIASLTVPGLNERDHDGDPLTPDVAQPFSCLPQVIQGRISTASGAGLAFEGGVVQRTCTDDATRTDVDGNVNQSVAAIPRAQVASYRVLDGGSVVSFPAVRLSAMSFCGDPQP